MEKVTFNAELVLTLKSKQDWVNRMPGYLPEKRHAEQLIWLDRYGNCLTIGEDFSAAQVQDSYPVKVYMVQRAAQTAAPEPEQELFYIRTRGFIGNGIVWWRPNSQGYTSDLKQAGKYPRAFAYNVCKSTHGGNLAYLCQKIDNLEEGLITQLHADYVPKADIGADFEGGTEILEMPYFPDSGLSK
jgi:hypothetical protein